MHPGRKTIMMSGMLCAGLLLSAGSGTALPLGAAAGTIGTAQLVDISLINQVRYRHHHHHYRGYGVGAGIAAGAIIGGIIASQGARAAAADADAIAYCSRRFRSYDPYSMTYLGRDGYRHRCP